MYNRLYIEFLYHFNTTKDYYECHEVMEEYWLSEGKNKLLQGLLQVAVGLHHFQNGNISGAVKLFEAALYKSRDTWNGELGINRLKLFEQTDAYLHKLICYTEVPFSFYPLEIEIIDPTLQVLVNECVPVGVADEDKF